MAGQHARRAEIFRLEPGRARRLSGAVLFAGFVALGCSLPAAAKGAPDQRADPLAGNMMPADRESVRTAQSYRDHRDRLNDRRWRDDDDDDDDNRNRRLRRSRGQRDDDDD